jgi:pimeloyl-ACP methyl ester carboxylesterase
MGYQLLEKQIEINGYTIYYVSQDIGSTSTPILLLHGWGVGLEPYYEAINSLSQYHSIIAPFLPGFGKSSDIEKNWNYNTYAQYIIKFIEKLNILKVHLIGHSLGGGIAATIAATAPHLVESIILIGSTGIPVEALPLVLPKRAIEMTAQFTQIKFPQLLQIFQGFSYNLFSRPTTVVYTLLLALQADIEPLLSNIQAPCLLLWGTNDMTIPIDVAHKFLRIINNSRLIKIEGVYHEWNILFINKFTQLVVDFIAEIEPKSYGDSQLKWKNG